jgi:hypothetical protein
MTLSSALPRLRQVCSAVLGGRSGRYTGRDVRALLHPDAAESDEHRRAVLATAAVPSAWLDYLGEREARELGRLAGRLPTMVSLHASGASSDEILRRVGGWSTWSVERALDAAARCIASRLNDRGSPTLRGAD